MNYRDFLEIIKDDNFDKNIYDKLVADYGFDLISKYFLSFMNKRFLSEEYYDKCKFFIEDDLKNNNFEMEKGKDLSAKKQYLEEIKKIKLLSPEEERTILVKLDRLKKSIKEMENNYKIKDYDANINELDLNDNSIEVLKEYLEIKKEYKLLSNKLIETNLLLVVKIAYNYENCGMDFLDLIQEGNMGIQLAIDKFDIEKGNRFSTYAFWWIRQYVGREIQKHSRTISIPVNKQEFWYKIKKVMSLYEKEYNKLPSNEELIEYIYKKVNDGTLNPSKYYNKLTPERLTKLQRAVQNVNSLNFKIGEDEDSTLEDIVYNEDQETVEEIVYKELIKKDIKSVLDEIKPRFKLIIILRYGLLLSEYMGYEEFLYCFDELEYSEEYYKNLYFNLCKYNKVYSLEQIATIYGITRERIRQIEFKTLRLIRNKNSKLKVLEPDFLDLYK